MDGQEEGSCRLEVDDGPELRGLLDWEIGRRGAPDKRTSRTRRSKWTQPRASGQTPGGVPIAVRRASGTRPARPTPSAGRSRRNF